jgi:hypothetical protein
VRDQDGHVTINVVGQAPSQQLFLPLTAH